MDENKNKCMLSVSVWNKGTDNYVWTEIKIEKVLTTLYLYPAVVVPFFKPVRIQSLGMINFPYCISIDQATPDYSHDKYFILNI